MSSNGSMWKSENRNIFHQCISQSPDGDRFFITKNIDLFNMQIVVVGWEWESDIGYSLHGYYPPEVWISAIKIHVNLKGFCNMTLINFIS